MLTWGRQANSQLGHQSQAVRIINETIRWDYLRQKTNWQEKVGSPSRLCGHLSAVICDLQQLPKPKHQEEKALSGDVLPSRCSQQMLSGLAEESKPVAAPAMHLLPTPLLPTSPEGEASAELWMLLWQRTTIPTFRGETQKLLQTTEQPLREQRGVKTWAACRHYMKVSHEVKAQGRLKASWRPDGTRNVQQLGWELGPGMGSSCCDERNTRQPPMWVWAPFSRQETCFYLSIANHAWWWEETTAASKDSMELPREGQAGGQQHFTSLAHKAN